MYSITYLCWYITLQNGHFVLLFLSFTKFIVNLMHLNNEKFCLSVFRIRFNPGISDLDILNKFLIALKEAYCNKFAVRVLYVYGLHEYAECRSPAVRSPGVLKMRSVENAEKCIFAVLSNFCVAICDFTPHPCKCFLQMLEIIETR